MACILHVYNNLILNPLNGGFLAKSIYLSKNHTFGVVLSKFETQRSYGVLQNGASLLLSIVKMIYTKKAIF